MKLIVLDCDGVISKGEAQPFNPALFARLANLNRQARRGEPVPAVTLNTGRPSPYVEAVMQAIEGWQPALFENGAGMYLPGPYQFKTTPLLTEAHKIALRQIVQRLDREFVQPGHLYWQPGKSVCHSLFAYPPHTIGEFLPAVQAAVAQISVDFKAEPAALALNIYPAHITKGSGLRWLSGEVGIDPADMAGVGDSASDVDFLRLVGHPAAPANATGDVKSVARFVASEENAAGLLQILDHWQV